MSPAPLAFYTAKQTSEQCGVSPRQIQCWIAARLLRPKMAGHAYQYSADDIRRVRLIRELRARGVGCAAIRRVLPRLVVMPAGYALIYGQRPRRVQHCEDSAEALRAAAKAASSVMLIPM